MNIYNLFFIIIILCIILLYYVNKRLNFEHFVVENDNCTTYDGKIGYINVDNNGKISCISMNNKINSNNNNSKIIVSLPTGSNPNYESIYKANDACNNYSGSDSIKNYGTTEIYQYEDGTFSTLCEKNYPKTYITKNSVSKSTINDSICKDKTGNTLSDSTITENLDSYGVKNMFLDSTDNKKANVVCGSGYSITPCLNKNQNFNIWCSYNMSDAQLKNTDRNNAGLRYTLGGDYNICSNNNETAVICSSNHYESLKKINTNRFTDCSKIPSGNNRNDYFNEKCKIIVDTTTNDAGATYKGLNTFAANIDSYDCPPDYFRAKCINQNDVSDFGDEERKSFIQQNNVLGNSQQNLKTNLFL
jgi:hypothetical protein